MKKEEIKKYIKENIFNYTRSEIAEELINNGIPKKDIIESFKEMSKYLNRIAKKKGLKGFILSICSFFLPVIGLILSIFGIKFANITQRIDKRIKLIKPTKVISWIGIIFHIVIIAYLLFLGYQNLALNFNNTDNINESIMINNSIMLTKYDIKSNKLFLNNSLNQNITGINITIKEINCTTANITLIPAYNNVTFNCDKKLISKEVSNFIIKYQNQTTNKKLIVE